MTRVSKSKVLLPLYIYPGPGAWDPLYAVYGSNKSLGIAHLIAPRLSRYTNLQFLVVVNPHSGPGSAPWWPNKDYIREIPRLNAHPNVTLLGYVRATYCKRPLKHVLEDVETYASRSAGDGGARLGMQGVFVDETVNLYTKEKKRYLDAIDCKVHEMEGYGGDRIVSARSFCWVGTGSVLIGWKVVHNPGTAVTAELAAPGPDITVVVETSYAHFVTKEYQEWLRTSPYGHSQSCYMVHSVPDREVEGLTKALRKRADYVFVTSATIDFYSKWAASWESFVAIMAAP